MAHEVWTECPTMTGLNIDGTVFVLEDNTTRSRAEVWPALGCNCFRWQVPWKGRLVDLLYSDPELFNGAKPTRSGIPILFPFPNRIRDGRFTWNGKTYQLPLNDSTSKNAIHGFAVRKPWRVVDQGSDAHSAWVSSEFCGSVDAPESRSLWPADYRIRITHRLSGRRLRLEIRVTNPDSVPLPFGLGFHPYFRIPLLPGGTEANSLVQAPAAQFWDLAESLPTGKQPPVDGGRDLRSPRRYQDLILDDVLTALPTEPTPGTENLCDRGNVSQTPDGIRLQVLASPAFREVVAFTPAHRQAVCLEPYTCTTDAINLQQRGVDAGLLVLEPGQDWLGTVELRCDTTGTGT